MAQPQMSAEDRFVAAVLYFIAWARRNTRALVLALSAVAILAFGLKYYVDYKHRLQEAAATQLRTLRFQLQTGSPDEVVEQLRTYLVQFGETEYGREARVLLAQALLMQNRAQEAIQPAREAMTDLGSDVVSMRAGFLLAAAYEEVGDTSAAIEVYREMGRKLDLRIQRSRALEGAARLLAARGDASAAAAVYEQLARMTPERAPARSYYEMRAAEMRAAALKPTKQELGAAEPTGQEG
jgi:predicted negative regulator of RcsB-dependent stress response